MPMGAGAELQASCCIVLQHDVVPHAARNHSIHVAVGGYCKAGSGRSLLSRYMCVQRMDGRGREGKAKAGLEMRSFSPL